MVRITPWSRLAARVARRCPGGQRGGAGLKYLLVVLLAAVVMVFAFTEYGHLVVDRFKRIADAIGNV